MNSSVHIFLLLFVFHIPNKALSYYKEGKDEVKKDCLTKSIKTIEYTPVNHQQPLKGTFTYRYEHILSSKEAPTIIYLPGGPGESSIGRDFLNSYASQFSRIYIDPRGVGCNFKGKELFDAADLTTQQHAQDVLAVITSLQLKNYYIYGISYGTVVGTLLAHKAEKTYNPPTALVLEGVLGKYFRSESQQAVASEWNKIVYEKPELRELITSHSINYTTKEWEERIAGMLYYSRNYLIETLSQIKVAVDENNIEMISALKTSLDQHFTDTQKDYLGTENFRAAVGCQEIFAPGNGVDELINGIFVNRPPTVQEWLEECGPYKLVNPWDSAKFQIQSPIYYLQGSADPATPIIQARYHFKSQNLSRMKIWAEVKNGGHTPSFGHDQLGPCISDVWKSIEKLEDFNKVLSPEGLCL